MKNFKIRNIVIMAHTVLFSRTPNISQGVQDGFKKRKSEGFMTILKNYIIKTT